MVIVGSGDLALATAALAVEHGVNVAAVVELGDRVLGNPDMEQGLRRRRVPFHTSCTVREARGRVGEVESVVLVAVDRELAPVAGTEREIECDTICLALGSVPSVELLHLAGARLTYAPALGGFM